MPPETSAVRTVNRISAILNCFSSDQPVLNLTAISDRLGLARSTTHRLLTALERQGFLTRALTGQGYHLGYQLLHWGALAQATLDVRNEALPILRELSTATGETAILSVRDGTVGICVEKVDSTQPVRLAMRAGQCLHLHAGASAKVLLAFLPEDEIVHILSQVELLPLERNTIIDPGLLLSELRAIRARGYATSFEETDCGAMGLAAPVYDHTKQVVAGIGIAAPLARVSPALVPALTESVLRASSELSQRLGGGRAKLEFGQMPPVDLAAQAD
jgi:DNA-binding IclR family transcriptional regulator